MNTQRKIIKEPKLELRSRLRIVWYEHQTKNDPEGVAQLSPKTGPKRTCMWGKLGFNDAVERVK